MNPLVWDSECTGAQRNKGNPFDPRNKMCCLSYRFQEKTEVLKIEYDGDPYKHKLEKFQEKVDSCDLVVGFNLKFDIHWGRRYGINFRNKRVWDCQLYHFLRSNQRDRFPSMNQAAEVYGIPMKLDIVKTEYWEKGLDTDQVPWYILEEYAAYDVDPVNQKLFEAQWAEYQNLPENRKKLIQLHMRDLLVLEEMEFNGSKYNTDLSKKMGDDLEHEIHDIDAALGKYSVRPMSFNSDEQVSLFLYGGNRVEQEQEDYLFTYKDPKKPPVMKKRWVDKTYAIPKIFEPLERTEKKKPGIYSTDKATLQKLRFKAQGFQQDILDKLMLRSKLEKRKSTYCYGTPALMEEMQWENSLLHGQLNQVTVVTGRLSCQKPNLQNQDGVMKICFGSRFPLNAH